MSDLREKAIEEVVKRRGSNVPLVREKLARSKPYSWTDHMTTIAVDGWERAFRAERDFTEALSLLRIIRYTDMSDDDAEAYRVRLEALLGKTGA